MAEIIEDEYGNEYEVIDEDEDGYSEAARQQALDLIEQHAAEIDGEEAAWRDHAGRRLGALERQLGHDLTNRQVEEIADLLRADPDTELDPAQYKVDFNDDTQRAEHTAQVMQDTMAEEDAAEEYGEDEPAAELAE